MNWIRPEKRLAIYLRDGLACCYCGASVEHGVKLTLDHLTPYAKGGTNESFNLVTACNVCNSTRGKRAWRTFAKVASLLNGLKDDAVVRYIDNTRRRVLDVTSAKALIEARGGFSEALQSKKGSYDHHGS